MTYSIVRGQIVQTLDDGRKRTVPAVQGNGDYADYLAWVAVGNTAQIVPDPTVAELAAAARTNAKAMLDRLDELGRLIRAETELTRKALNRIQSRVDQLVAGIVAQSTYANLRTAAGQLAAMGTYTKVEVLQLFKDEITGDA